MRALALVTHTADCENKWRSFQCLGHEVRVEQYDDRPHDRHDELVDLAKAYAPDLVIYVGAIEKYHGRPVPSPDVLKRLRDLAPTVHICGDASDDPWWEWLDLYEKEGCFSVQVSIDGSLFTPVTAYGLVLLTPVDLGAFQPKPWKDRSIPCSLVGGVGHTRRAELVGAMRSAGKLRVGGGPTYAAACSIMSDSKFTFNVPWNGTGDKMHVKGRVVEAGFAGSCLLELKGSPTGGWFTPGVDYVEYSDPRDAIFCVDNADDPAYREVAKSLFQKCWNEHHPAIFWRKVLDRCGVTSALWPDPVPDPRL